MRRNKTKAKLKAGEPVFGVIAKSDDPLLAELVGFAGFDYYMLDGEHGLLNPAMVANVVRACEVADVTPLVRIGQNDPKVILPYLDAGMMGVMMPGLESAESVEKFVRAMKLPPAGNRGLGLSRQANYFMTGDVAQFVTEINDELLIWTQFEEIGLLDSLADLASVAGVDGVVIGPRDLSASMGFADGPNHPEVAAAIDQAIAILKQAKVDIGITAGSAESAQQQLDRGANIILNSLPGLIKAASADFLQVRAKIG